MFYLKYKWQKLPIRHDNVYTVCPQCGREHHIDLGETACFMGEEFDLESTHVYCGRCSAKRERRRAAGLPVSYPND